MEISMSSAATRALLMAFTLSPVAAMAQQDPFVAPYAESCVICHGVNFEGAPQGTPLVGTALRHGSSVDAIAKSIAEGFPRTGMPGWSATLSDVQIRRLAIF